MFQTNSDQMLLKADNFLPGSLLSLSELKHQKIVEISFWFQKFACVLHVKCPVKYPLYSVEFTYGCKQFASILREVLAA